MTIKTRFDKGEVGNIRLDDLCVEIAADEAEKDKWNRLMEEHHYLHNSTLAGPQIRYAISCRGKTVALLSFSSCAYHLALRDTWIGWNQTQMAQRRHFVAANSRFLILPGVSTPNLASKSLALCLNRLSADWQARFGHPILVVETFTEQRFPGTSYKADNWNRLGATQGFSRDGGAFYIRNGAPKTLWVKELHGDARRVLASPALPENLVEFERAASAHTIGTTITPAVMGSLREALATVPDPRRKSARTQSMGACLSIIVIGFLCGCEGLAGCAVFARNLRQSQLKALWVRCDKKTRCYRAPCHTTLWLVMNKVDPGELAKRIQTWVTNCESNGTLPECLAIDGKTLRGSEDENGLAMHVVTALSHEGQSPFLPKRRRIAKAAKARPCATSSPNSLT